MIDRSRPLGADLVSDRALLLAATAVAAFFFASSVCEAQAVGQAPASPTPGGPAPVTNEIQDIVVTASKRAQSLNSVGMAITALTGSQLARQGVVSTADLVKVVPGLTFAQSQTGTPVYTIRGIGYYDASLSAAPAVSVYQDEIGYAFPVMTEAATLDLERVEVLKGPQGTLYGQNATGGAINYIAAKPLDHYAAGLDWTYARFNAVDVDGYITGPITDTLSFRLAGAVDEGGDWQKSYTTGQRQGASDVKKGRLLISWKPTDKLKVLLNANGWRDNSDSIASALSAYTPEAEGRPGSAYPQEAEQVIGPHEAGTADWTTSVPRKLDESFYQGSARIDYDVSDALGITSLTSYEHYTQNNTRDIDGSALDVYHLKQTGYIHSFSQELRLHGNLMNDRLFWILGGDYNRDSIHELNTEFLTYSTLARAFAAFGIGPFPGVTQLSNNKITTKAVFGNAEFKVTPTVTLHGGVRYTSVKDEFNGCSQTIDPNLALGNTLIINLLRSEAGLAPISDIPVGACTTINQSLEPGLISNKLDQHNVSWRGSADWKIVPGILLYASVSKGYKAGGFPTLGATSYVQLQPVTQESVMAYEAGLKYSSRHISFDAAFFDYDYSNKQFRARTIDPLGIFGAVEALVNIPKSNVKGGEATLTIKPLSGLTLTASGTYIHSRVTSHFVNYDALGNVADFYGEKFPFTPKWSGQFNGYYEHPLSASISAFLGGNVTYQSKTTSAFGDNALVDNIAYALLDLQAGIEAPDGNWRVTLFGKNVTNKYYWTDAFRETDNVSRHVGMPATYGITFSKKF